MNFDVLGVCSIVLAKTYSAVGIESDAVSKTLIFAEIRGNVKWIEMNFNRIRVWVMVVGGRGGREVVVVVVV